MATAQSMRESPGETIVLDETGLAPLQVKVKAGSSTFLVDEPIGAGGLGSGPNPYDLLSAAIGSCSMMTMRLYANRKRWPLERIRIKVTHYRESLQAKDTFLREIQLSGELNDEQRAKIIDVSTRCPVHITLERGSDVKTVLLASAAMDDSAVTRCEHSQHVTEACGEETG